jgi:hypothetical protein
MKLLHARRTPPIDGDGRTVPAKCERRTLNRWPHVLSLRTVQTPKTEIKWRRQRLTQIWCARPPHSQSRDVVHGVAVL